MGRLATRSLRLRSPGHSRLIRLSDARTQGSYPKNWQADFIVFAFLHSFERWDISNKKTLASVGQTLASVQKKKKMNANLFNVLQTKYTVSGTQLTPTNGQTFRLQVRPSKFFGRPDFLQARITGTAKPLFVSSCYEARTKDGLWNIEVDGKRLEAVPLANDEIQLVPLSELRRSYRERSRSTQRKSYE